MKNKRIFKILLFIVLVVTFLVPSFDVSALSLADLRAQLQGIKDEKAAAENKSASVQSQIDATNAEISAITIKISELKTEQDNLNKEIKELEEKISEKEQQIKDLVSFYQLSSNENFYLKYLFGADSFEDFIYRFSVIEQLTTKSDELVEEMNTLVSDNKTKITELENSQAEQERLSREAQEKVSSLGTEKATYIEEAEGYDSQIAAVQELINSVSETFTKNGCSETTDISSCGQSGGYVPYDLGFNKPLTHGMVTDEFGMRYHPTQHIWKLHSGIDLGGNSEGTNIYAPAAGTVVRIVWRSYCGGNQVYLNHVINGVPYTTQYMHMLNINVSVGDVVAKGQVIGTVGGGRATSSYETCSTGAHLHFMVATGHYYGTDGRDCYTSYSTYVNRLLNPRDVLYFPAYGVWW